MTTDWREYTGCPACGAQVSTEYPFDAWVRTHPDLESIKDGIVITDEEEFLYPPSSGRFLGGGKFMRYCWDAAIKGWPHARDNLEQDKAGKAGRVSRRYRNSPEAWELLPLKT